MFVLLAIAPFPERCLQSIQTSADRHIGGFVCTAAVAGLGASSRAIESVHSSSGMREDVDKFVLDLTESVTCSPGRCGGELQMWDASASEFLVCGKCRAQTVSRDSCEAAEQAGALALNSAYRDYAGSSFTEDELRDLRIVCLQLFRPSDGSLVSQLHPYDFDLLEFFVLFSS
jgi:hypothetical protein